MDSSVFWCQYYVLYGLHNLLLVVDSEFLGKDIYHMLVRTGVFYAYVRRQVKISLISMNSVAAFSSRKFYLW